ncbi:MAG TPA: family 16 glycoside hydrolase [Gemmataceae bacterium]|jgi:hypothetical protein|nr:family 16 glycoside hydrolase [Gemmataceae bacterium]
MMKPLCCLAAMLLALAVATPAFTDDKKPDGRPKDDGGFVPLFDGRSLAGWVNVNCDKSTFFVKDNEIITTGKPTGYLRTQEQYENFIAEFDWMHVPPKRGAVGNSGFFVWADPIPAVGTGYTRGIEVQVLVNLTYKNNKGAITATSQGDLFSIWGATCVPDRPHPDGWARCLPSENHCKGEKEWNHYRVVAQDGVIKLAVNGKVVSGVSRCSPRKGYLALESEGSECHFRNLKIKALPSTNPKKDEIADKAKGHKPLYTGLDLSGWKVDAKAKKHWEPQDTVLHYDGKGAAKDNGLRTRKEYGDAEYIADFRFPKDAKQCVLILRQDKDGMVALAIKRDGSFVVSTVHPPQGGKAGKSFPGNLDGVKAAGQWNRLRAVLKGTTFKISVNGGRAKTLEELEIPSKGAFGLMSNGDMDFTNLFVRELK